MQQKSNPNQSITKRSCGAPQNAVLSARANGVENTPIDCTRDLYGAHRLERDVYELIALE